MFELVEKFITIGGEAPLIGIPIYLVRFSGCNLDCIYCDTPYKNEVNDNYTSKELMDDISNKIKEYTDLKVLFTGGEPFLENRQEELLKIIFELENIDFYIETNGSINLHDFNLKNCYYVLDWKSPSSNFNDTFIVENLNKLRIEKDCVKFIINATDFEWLKDAIKLVQKINPFIPLYVSPQYGKLSLEETADFILKNRLPLKLSFQLHKIIWPNKDRGI